MSRLATLFRSGSDADVLRQTRYEADTSNFPKGMAFLFDLNLSWVIDQLFYVIHFRSMTDSIDCGITSLGWCNSISCQRLGNSNTFLAVFVVAGLLQGAVGTYFRISAKQVALQYDFDPILIGKRCFRHKTWVIFYVEFINRLVTCGKWIKSGTLCNSDCLLG